MGYFVIFAVPDSSGIGLLSVIRRPVDAAWPGVRRSSGSVGSAHVVRRSASCGGGCGCNHCEEHDHGNLVEIAMPALVPTQITLTSNTLPLNILSTVMSNVHAIHD